MSQDGYSEWKVWESKRTAGCVCRRRAAVYSLIMRARLNTLTFGVFPLNWLLLKGSAPQLNVTAALSLLSVPCRARAVHLLTRPCGLDTKKHPSRRRHGVWATSQSLMRRSLQDTKSPRTHRPPRVTQNVMNTEWVCARLHANICMLTRHPHLRRDKPGSTLLLLKQ